MSSLSQMKRERKDFDEEEVRVLEEAWEEGMTNTKKPCKDKIMHVARQLNTAPERIEVWIGNKRAKVKRAEGATSKPSQGKKYNCGPNAYSLFLSSQERGSQDPKSFFKSSAIKWKGLPSEEKAKFSESSAHMRECPILYMDREQVIKQKLQVISEAANDLQTVGYSFGGLGLDLKGGPISIAGSHKAINFFKCHKLEEQYRAYFNLTDSTIVSKEQTGTPKPNKEGELMELRHKVRQKFNECWEKATGSARIPYSNLKARQVNVVLVGCPSVPFKEPSCYGKSSLRTVLSNLKSFDIQEQQSSAVSKPDIKMPSDTSPNKALVSEALSDILLHEQISEESSIVQLDPENRVTEVVVENLKNGTQQFKGKNEKNARKRNVQNELMQLMTKKNSKKQKS